MESGRPTRSRDIVGTFLESVKTVRPSYDSTSSGATAAQTIAAKPTIENEPVESSEHGGDLGSQTSGMPAVLQRLSEAGEQDITELAAGLGMPLLRTAGLLGKLESSGLVTIGGEPGQERVALTEAGRTVATLS
jgi:predicted transcriptional regulator